MAKRKLTVVIVSYNVRYYLQQCLYSLQRALEGIDSHICVVDNHSADDSVGYLQSKFPDVEFVASQHNLGFARANNIALRRADSEYVLLLNPDTIVLENTIRESLRFMDEHQEAGSVGVRMLRSDGVSAPESRRGMPSPLTAFWRMVGMAHFFPRSKRFARYYMGHLSWDEPAEIDVVSGAYCMIRRSVLDKIGLLDEDFFMYGEDIDLSFRIQKAGYSNWYLPYSILHYKGESTQKSSFRYVHVFYTAMLIFLRKHYGGLGYLLSLPIRLGIYLRALVALLAMMPHLIQKTMALPRVRKNYPNYCFVGTKQNVESVMRLLESKAVNAEYYEVDSAEKYSGHANFVLSAKSQSTVVIYDASLFSYEQIFSYFTSAPVPNVQIGLYYASQGMVVTVSDVFVNNK